ncbi:DUF6939 family protein [Dictyobacter kobayashii]|uniref:Uncharacterized protein n=1 Tax=Dictyobacter kobayashii TaxID=2014872 RepID=A0A402AYJ3_9CHLR|nr:hypothetical protein [Dictyobacter kobayashii]GCE24179.1 hypothetical protein KDK_79790 [Dictyobacter kobayashii]
MLVVQNHRTSPATIQQRYPGARIIDVTSQGVEPWIRFSPFYPHGGIPVPFSPGWSSASVEGIWQGLKVFERADIDTGKFTNTSMRQLKRTVRTYGRVLGHRAGVNGKELLPYLEARQQIYLPSYQWVIEHCLQEQLAELRRLSQNGTVVLLDYETNTDLNDPSKPLSHAGLIIHHLT